MVHTIAMPSSRDLLEKLLRGEPPSPDEIGNLLRTHTREDGRLEYKRGEWLHRDALPADDPKDPGARLKKYATAFANAEGGLLLIGVSGGEEGQGCDKWSVVGCPTPPEAGWKSWAGQVLAGVASRALVFVHEITVESKTVLAVVTDRANNLIEVVEQSKLVRYLRVDEHTVRITDALYADFVLGRRSRPDVSLVGDFVSADNRGDHTEVVINAEIHNDGLVWIPECQLGLVGYTNGSGQHLTESLRRHTDVRDLRDRQSELVARLHVKTIDRAIRPFEIVTWSFSLRLPPRPDPWRWHAALFANPSNGYPVWAQINVFGHGTSTNGRVEVIRENLRPRVDWSRGSEAWS